MAERDEGQERTEQATERRLEQAREQGQIARSRELANLGLLLSGALGLLAFGPRTVSGLADLMRRAVSLDRTAVDSGPGELLTALESAAFEALVLILPLLAVLMVAALISPLALGGWSLSSEAIAFKPERLDPVRGLRRLISLNGLAELAKALAKFLVLGTAAGLILWTEMDRLLALGRQPLAPALAEAAEILGTAFLVLCAALALIAAVDVPYQFWQHRHRLRMSRQELKEEYKETEGKPEVKSRIRNLQREMARRRMMQEVPKADVVVTNPTHYAVALRYAAEAMTAPRVVAKGADLLAERIRTLASEHGVPLVGAPPLARALYHNTRLNQEIPAGLYLAVAQVLAYVFALQRYRKQGGQAPAPPADLPIPDELTRPA